MIPLRRVLLAGVCAIGSLFSAQYLPAHAQAHPDFVGSLVCAECHSDEARRWRGSHHALAWTQPDDATVLGDFDAATFEHGGETTRFFRGGEAFFVRTQGPDGANHDYRVLGVAGIAPLQQYIVETEPGRLQALDTAWDIERGRWYHLYPGQDLPPGDGLHWSGPYKTWNARCAECHATAYEKNYDPQARRYASRQAEIGVGCEACHGPGGAHVAWAKNPQAYDAGQWRNLTDAGFTIALPADAPEAEIQQCAGCHSRREPFSGTSPIPGTPFHDSYRLALLREGLYHADGAIHDEVYVYGSYLQSRMYARGVRCSDCHDPHATELKAEGNAVCAQCHSPAGNPRFATLRKAGYDDPAHHFHESGKSGSNCVDCHMIERVYMGIDGRRDHSFRVPRPDLSAGTGAPNACTDCHAERGAAWAAAEIATRFPDSTRRGPHFAQVFAAARRDPVAHADALVAIALNREHPGVVRASALDLLQPTADAALAARTARLLADPDPLLREAAAAVQRGAPPGDRARRIAPLLEDRMRSVRIAAAREFLDVSPSVLSQATVAAAGRAMAEWRASLLARTDFPETHLALGGAALATRNFRAAEAAFREAVRLDPQRVEAWSMIVRIGAALGDPDGARAALDEALRANPSDAGLQDLGRSLPRGGR